MSNRTRTALQPHLVLPSLLRFSLRCDARPSRGAAHERAAPPRAGWLVEMVRAGWLVEMVRAGWLVEMVRAGWLVEMVRAGWSVKMVRTE